MFRIFGRVVIAGLMVLAVAILAAVFVLEPQAADVSPSGDAALASDEQAVDDSGAVDMQALNDFATFGQRGLNAPIIANDGTLEPLVDPQVVENGADTTLSSPVSGAPTGGKWIDVNLSRQTVTAYIDSMPLKTVLVSTGTRIHPTVVGTFHVYVKIPSQRMTGGSRARGDYYSLPGVPNVMYFFRGYALHGTYWHHNFGHPMSHGCVNLTLSDAAWFYTWTPMGTPVVSHY
jgi:lipoprotein-anchoring transpeptidase ErfK/SrfK